MSVRERYPCELRESGVCVCFERAVFVASLPQLFPPRTRACAGLCLRACLCVDSQTLDEWHWANGISHASVRTGVQNFGGQQASAPAVDSTQSSIRDFLSQPEESYHKAGGGGGGEGRGEGRAGAADERGCGANASYGHGNCRDGGVGHEARGHSGDLAADEALRHHPESRELDMFGADFGAECRGAQGGGRGAGGGVGGGGGRFGGADASRAPIGASSCGMTHVAGSGAGAGAGRKRQRVFQDDDDSDED